MFLAHVTHAHFEYLLDLDVMTFNALLDAATRLDASRWTQRAWMIRAAFHAEAKGFEKMVKDAWGFAAPEPEKPGGKGIAALIRDFGGGF